MQIKTKNINCQSCVNLIKASLEDEFGPMQIDIENKTINIDLQDNQIQNFKDQLKDLGFEVLEND
ncbi:heavy-metal-associated domain-containing protein [Campylobacter insulaenigrae]|uniref:Heavy-metal-associated domain-containing protein n=2 Tax=Campylobacter insulaenigrae TaxID=260714 RepID=A0ABY3G3G4_9BACT|nr:heavy-metal-associated domain-containing protein [Campylobacter insulaenigrae]AJC88005.1 heavy-metal-associated domain protein, putative copper metallochaperone CopZ [Campylobacter insulaenigrae NCTC 12927]MCR6571613.1 heavy-metal-associated domain-containing protein [Campylobacter insulaenigrae]MCR6577247.1 heavy-metal-associated domain-containing protein [Campylobacter insulaenigrae]MCR6578056.1 heavy-metal-associated domain-containing protein [Campylobacter insulaenigrae]MCR6582335.1 hea